MTSHLSQFFMSSSDHRPDLPAVIFRFGFHSEGFLRTLLFFSLSIYCLVRSWL